MSMRKVIRAVVRAINVPLNAIGYALVPERRLVDFFLFDYASYEEYKETQIAHNIRKLKNVWADKATLDAVCDIVREVVPGEAWRGLCHGTRNGFEQNYIAEKPGFDAIGTDISPTATDFPRSVVWDFHDENPEWVGAFDFVYTNSHDQGWNPKKAMAAWLNQLNANGVLIIEHTDMHGPMGANRMDPFGVRPTALPYVLAEWFGHDVSVSFRKVKKDNMDMEAWLFIVKKTVARIG